MLCVLSFLPHAIVRLRGRSTGCWTGMASPTELECERLPSAFTNSFACELWMRFYTAVIYSRSPKENGSLLNSSCLRVGVGVPASSRNFKTPLEMEWQARQFTIPTGKTSRRENILLRNL